MRVAILGGGGFIGSAVTSRLLRDGYQIRVLDRTSTLRQGQAETAGSVDWRVGDFGDNEDVEKTLLGVDVVIHLVSTTLPGNSNADMVFDVESNLVATLRLLSAMVRQKVRKIVFISSGGTVYGEPRYLPIDEAHPTNPRVSYGVTKLAIEKYILLFRHLHGIEATILRVTNPFGEYQRAEAAQGVIATFLSRAIHGRPIDIWGDGTVTRDYIYVGDVADAFSHAVRYEGPESVFNIGSGVGTSLNELIAMMESLLGRHVPRQYHSARSFDVATSVLDSSLARHELGWVPRISLSEGLRKTADWVLRGNPESQAE